MNTLKNRVTAVRKFPKHSACLIPSLCFSVGSSTEDLTGLLEKNIQETMGKGDEFGMR